MNKEVKELDNITLEDFKKSIYLVMTSPITSVAPLGFCGDDYYLYGHKLTKEEKEKFGHWRTSSIRFRNYCNSPEILITDYVGNFIYHCNCDLQDYDLIAKTYYNVFLEIKDKIDVENPRKELGNIDFANVEYTKGWDMLKAYLKEM